MNYSIYYINILDSVYLFKIKYLCKRIIDLHSYLDLLNLWIRV